MPLGNRQFTTLRWVAEALLPTGGALAPGAIDTDVAGRLASFVGGLPGWQTRAMGAMLVAWELSPLISSYRRPFGRLSPAERQAYMRVCLQRRRGLGRALALWLKSLCLMAYCSHPRVEEAIGFTGSCLDDGPPQDGPRLEPIAYPHIRGRVEERADVCVVGSGAGGAVVAKELAEAGLSVIVLEEGSYFRRPDFQGSPWERMQRLYRNRGLTAAFGRSVVPIPLGKCVGGTTVVNSGTCFRTPERVLRRWEAAGIEGVDSASMEPIFQRVEEELSVQPVPREIIGRNALTFQSGVEALGLHGRPIQRAIRGCRGCGVCTFGCPSDAKQAMHISYLPKAAARGARVFAGCRADHILVEEGRAIGVEADILDPATEQVQGRLRVRARVVVLAAGAIHTPALLMRNGLSGGPVGRNLSIHPAIGVGALFDEEVFGWRGTLQSYYVDDLHESLGVLLEVTSPLPGVSAVSLPGAGPELKQALSDYKHLASVGLFVSDSATGRVVGNRWWSEPLTFYLLSHKDAACLQRGMALAAEVFLEAGARTVYTGLARLPTVAGRRDLERLRDTAVRPEELTVVGFHPMGTCRMGREPATSVVGPYGESHAVRNLFLADASVLPSCAGVNPQVTIMALATRTAFHLLENSGRYFW
jgi:choline dehydrogenase-like flavoprotein